MSRSQEFAYFINRTPAVLRGDFTLKSGRKAKIFFNFGNICNGMDLDHLGIYYSNFIYGKGLYEEGDILFGPAYKGIIIASAISQSMYRSSLRVVPFAYNRKDEKSHGEAGSFIGYDLNKANGVIVVDDVITDGGTKFEVINMLKQFPNINIKAFIVGIDRQEKNENGEFCIDVFRRNTGIPTYALTTKEEILKIES